MPAFAEPTAEEAARCAERGAEAECALCGGTLLRHNEPRLFRWAGAMRLSEEWTCTGCGTGGNVLRDRETGHPVRLSHILTGEGNVTPGGNA